MTASGRQRSEDPGHVGHVCACGDTNEVTPVYAHSGIVRLHCGQPGNAGLTGDLAHQPAGQAVAAGIERRTGDDYIRLILPDHVGNEGLGFRFVFHEVVVAADYRREDRSRVSKRGIQRPSRADRSFDHVRRIVGVVLTSNSTEELIDVVNHLHIRRLSSLHFENSSENVNGFCNFL